MSDDSIIESKCPSCKRSVATVVKAVTSKDGVKKEGWTNRVIAIHVPTQNSQYPVNCAGSGAFVCAVERNGGF